MSVAWQYVLTLQSSACVPKVESKWCSSTSNQITPIGLRVSIGLRRMWLKSCQQWHWSESTIMFQLAAQAPFSKVKRCIYILLTNRGGLWGGTESLHYSTQWLVFRMSAEAVFHAVTSFRFMCRPVTLSANRPGRALSFKWSRGKAENPSQL